jgi:hypothetical protein
VSDKLDNIRAVVAADRVLGEAFWERFHSRADTLWYYGELAEIFTVKAPGPMAEELQRSVACLRARI